MFIEYIYLKNYRQYKKQKIEFDSIDARRNIVVIEGDTGSGKTNLLNSITWCLYGKEKSIGEKTKGLPIINTTTIHEMDVDDEQQVKVEIQLKSNDETKVINIQRTIFFRKLLNGRVEQILDNHRINQKRDHSFLSVTTKASLDRYVHNENNPDKVINQLFPENIGEYFFFDGEKLDMYFKETSGKEIKDIVFQFSQIELLDRMIKHIGEARSDYFKGEKDIPEKIKKIQKAIKTNTDQMNFNENEIANLTDQKIEAIKNKDEIIKQLSGININEVKQLNIERERINQEMISLRNEIGTKKRKLKKCLIEKAPVIYSKNIIKSAYDRLREDEASGKLPPAFRKNFVERLLIEGVCICGCSLKDDPQKQERLKKLIESSGDLSDFSIELIELCATYSKMLDSCSNFKVEIEQIEEGLNKTINDLDRKNVRLKEIDDAIKRYDMDKLSRLEDRYQGIDKSLDKIGIKIGRLMITVENYKKSISELEQQLSKEMDKEEKLSFIKKVNDFAKKSLDVADDIRYRIVNDTRNKIQEKTNSYFLNMIWKKETYKSVVISDDYDIMVYDNDNRPSVSTLSAGEREALALSLMSALKEISGFDVPYIIDTPLARIASRERNNIIDSINVLFKDTQVILLVTDVEYTKELKDKMRDVITREYKINFFEKIHGSEAEVIPYGKR